MNPSQTNHDVTSFSLVVKFTGTIPTEVGNMASLEVFRVDANKVEGTIPTEVGNLLELVELRLEKNEIIGTLPTQLGQVENMIDLRVYSNKLVGTIPTELKQLKAIEVLYLGMLFILFKGYMLLHSHQVTRRSMPWINLVCFLFIQTETALQVCMMPF